VTPRRRTEVLDGQRDAVTLCRCYTVILEFTPYPHQLAEKGKVTVKSRAVLGFGYTPIPTDARLPGGVVTSGTRFVHYGSSIPAFTRSGVAYTQNLCIREGVRIRTRCVYAPTARVNAPTRVYAPWGAYTHVPAYTHPPPRTSTYA